MTARRLLIDNCVAAAVAELLRAEGHDVTYARELGPDPGDQSLLELAVAERRILVTIDTDFGTLVFRDHRASAGVLRLRERRAAVLAERASALITSHGDALEAGTFVTDDGDSVRLTQKP